MRVLLVHNRYRSASDSGENVVVDRESDLLREAGHAVVRYVRESDEIARSPLREKAMLPARVVWSGRDHRALSELAARSRPDVVHIHNTFPMISPSAIHAVGGLDIPIVMTLHNFRLFCANGLLFRDGHPCEDCLGTTPLPGLAHGCYRGSRLATMPISASIAWHGLLRTWDRVSAFVALSRFARRKLVAGGLPSERIVIKPNFVRRPDRPRVDGGSHFLFLGRLAPEKGVDLLLSAWDPRLGTLWIAGDGPARPALEASAARHQGSVRFLGHRSRSECEDLLRSARALVVPSRTYEGSPAVLCEAFAHAVPVIAPAHGAFPEVVEDRVSGSLFRPGDPADLARGLRELTDPQRSRAMGSEARRSYEARYTPERNLAALTAIYERVCASRGVGEDDGPRRRVAAASEAAR